MTAKDNSTGIDIFIPFAEHLGIRAHFYDAGEAEISMTLRSEHENSWGAAHGGVILSMFDMVMGLSAKSVDPSASGAITIELKTNFLQTVTGSILAKARAIRAGRNLIFVEAELFNAEEQLAAKASGTFKLKYPKEQTL